MGPQHVRDGVLSIEQVKTGNRVDIPLHPNLLRSIEACPSGHLTFVVTEFGKPFSVKGFQQWFVDAVKKAGLPSGLSGHGLRKAASRRLADLDCSEDQIMAITGHETSDEARKYLKDANRKKLARSAMDRLIRSGTENE
jgi:integrase